MNKLKMIFSALFGATLAACARSENITTVDAAAFERAVTKDSVQLVDVRTAEEYADHHILYAVNIDVMQPDFKDKASAMLDASKPAYVYWANVEVAAKRSAMEVFLALSSSVTFVEGIALRTSMRL